MWWRIWSTFGWGNLKDWMLERRIISYHQPSGKSLVRKQSILSKTFHQHLFTFFCRGGSVTTNITSTFANLQTSWRPALNFPITYWNQQTGKAYSSLGSGIWKVWFINLDKLTSETLLEFIISMMLSIYLLAHWLFMACFTYVTTSVFVVLYGLHGLSGWSIIVDTYKLVCDPMFIPGQTWIIGCSTKHTLSKLMSTMIFRDDLMITSPPGLKRGEKVFEECKLII